MTQEEILEGNKLIAEFMELQKDEESGNYHIVNEPHIHASCLMSIEYLQYHSSWDWLMPVVEKIRSLNKMVLFHFWSFTNATECKIYNWELGSEEIVNECESSFEAVYLTVIEFIKQYNQSAKDGK